MVPYSFLGFSGKRLPYFPTFCFPPVWMALDEVGSPGRYPSLGILYRGEWMLIISMLHCSHVGVMVVG